MEKDQKVLTSIVKRLIDNGTMDELILAALETDVEGAFAHLDTINPNGQMFQDYVEVVSFIRAAIRVMQYYSTNKYEHLTVRVNQYSMKLDGVYL